jgi:fucokinase
MKIQLKVSSLRSCEIFCIADPEGKRVGSGGGTLNSIDYLINTIGKDCLYSSKTLIIHSGGDSRRAPLHSVCGKAWTTLNGSINEQLIATPIILLIEELSLLSDYIPLCSITIASCDVLLDIAPNVIFQLFFNSKHRNLH